MVAFENAFDRKGLPFALSLVERETLIRSFRKSGDHSMNDMFNTNFFSYMDSKGVILEDEVQVERVPWMETMHMSSYLAYGGMHISPLVLDESMQIAFSAQWSLWISPNGSLPWFFS